MNNTSTSIYKKQYINKNDLTYAIEETCPVCGIYQPDGNVCKECQKDYGLLESKVEYIEY